MKKVEQLGIVFVLYVLGMIVSVFDVIQDNDIVYIITTSILAVGMFLVLRTTITFGDMKTKIGSIQREHAPSLIMVILIFMPSMIFVSQFRNYNSEIVFFKNIVYGAWALVTFYVVVAYFFNHVTRQEDGFKQIFYIPGRVKEVKYRDVDKMWFNIFINTVVLKTKDGKKYYVDIMLNDIQKILIDIIEQVDAEGFDKTFKSLFSVYKTFGLKRNNLLLQEHLEKKKSE